MNRGTDLSTYAFGKIPPQNKEIEVAVLGGIMLDSGAMIQVAQILKPDHFYVNAHNLVYSAMVRLFSESKPIDILTVSEELKRTDSLENAGGRYAVTQLTENIMSSAHIEHHARIVKEMWVKREIIRVSSTQIKNAYEDSSDSLELLGTAVNDFGGILNEVTSGSVKPFYQVVDETFKGIAQAALKSDDEKYVIGLSTGVYSLDHKTLGLSSPDFILYAGRPRAAKTTLAIAGALKNAKDGIPQGIFSLEMSENQLVLKMAAMETGIDLELLRSGRATREEWERIDAAQELIRGLPIYVYDRRGIYMSELKAIAKGWKAKYGVKAFYVDYIQLLKYDDKRLTREQEVSAISRELKALARDVECPVVGICALSRKLEDRGGWDKRPKDSDLREGGSLEFDPDMIIFVFRPENHGLMDDEGISTQGVVEFIVAKNRLGSLGIVRKYINDGTGVFMDAPTQQLREPKVVRNFSEKDEENLPF